jgi:hypothetical protein
VATQLQVIQLHQKYPTLTATQIAGRLDCSPEYVRATGRRRGLTFPGSRTERVRQPDGLMMLGRAARAAGLTVEQIEQIARENAGAGKAVRP